MPLAFVLSALPLEYNTVRAHLSDVRVLQAPGPVLPAVEVGGFVGFHGEEWEVAIACLGARNAEAAAQTGLLLNDFQPAVAFFSGIAMGRKDVSHADVVAASKLYDYQAGVEVIDRETGRAGVRARPELYRPPRWLELRAREVAATSHWLERVDIPDWKPDVAPKALVAPIASGDRLIKTPLGPTEQVLREHFDDSAAVEMEGFGFVLANHLHGLPALVIRGVSDVGGDKAAARDAIWQPRAAATAAAFTLELLASLRHSDPPLRAPQRSAKAPARSQRGQIARNNLPGVMTQFTDRPAVMQSLRDELGRGVTALTQTYAVHGLGGIGKTRLAVELAGQMLDRYAIVWLVRAGREETRIADLAALAEELELVDSSAQDEDVRTATLEWMRANDDWLVILDDAVGPEILAELLPSACRGHVLVTSRNDRAWREIAVTYRLDVMNRSESLRLLQTRSGGNGAADEVAEALGDLPLALVQAGSYVAETGISFVEYLERLRDNAAELFGAGRPFDYEQTVATTWELAFREISRNPSAEAILLLSAFCAPDQIPRDLFEPVVVNAIGAEQDARMALDQAFGELLRFSLVTPAADSVDLHRLVAVVTRARLDPDRYDQVLAYLQGLLEAAWPHDSDQRTNWSRCEQLLTHGLAAVGYAVAEHRSNDTANLLFSLGRYQFHRGRYASSEELLERCAELAADVSPDSIFEAFALDALADTQAKRGRIDPALVNAQRAVELLIKAEGEASPRALASMTKLGLGLRDHQMLGQAVELLRRVLAIQERAHGPASPELVPALNNLANTLRDSSEGREAQAVLERAAALTESRPELAYQRAAIQSNLAEVLFCRRQDAAAFAHAEMAVLAYKELRGEDHPDLIIPLQVMARTLGACDRRGEAEVHIQRALEIANSQLGADHPLMRRVAADVEDIRQGKDMHPPHQPDSLEEELDRLRTIPDEQAVELLPELGRIAETLRRLGRYADAECTVSRGIEQGERLFTEPNSSLAAMYGILGMVKRAQGNPKAAVDWLQRSFDAFEKLDQRAEMARALSNLGNALDSLQDFESAVEAHERAVILASEALGPADPRTVQYLNNLAVSFALAGDEPRLGEVIDRIDNYRHAVPKSESI